MPNLRRWGERGESTTSLPALQFVLFADEQDAGIGVPDSPADSAAVKLANSNTSAAIAVTEVSNLTFIAAGKG